MVVEPVLPLLTLATAILMLAPILWIASSLSGVVGARALQLVVAAAKLVAVPLLHLLLTADDLALLHWRNNKSATLLIAQFLWIASSLIGVVGARALQLVAAAATLVAVPLLHLLLMADNLALLHWRNK